MEIQPPLQSALNLVVFVSNLIELQKFNTIVVLHDQAHRNTVSVLIESPQPRYDVTWMVINDFLHTEHLKENAIHHEKTLILSACLDIDLFENLFVLYQNRFIEKHSNIIIVSIDISTKTYFRLHQNHYNAVYVNLTLEEIKIKAWNVIGAEQFVELNQTEFLNASNPDVTNRAYTGVFFNQLQSLRGEPATACITFDKQNVYKVISKDSVTGIDGALVRMLDMISETMQSVMTYAVVILTMKDKELGKIGYTDFLERTYRSFAPVQPRNVHIMPFRDLLGFVYGGTPTVLVGIMSEPAGRSMAYPYGFDNFVIVVENNMTTSATQIQRILETPVIYFWMLLILTFVVIRCGLQWIIESGATNAATKRRKCVLMCEDTVQLSCGVVLNDKWFASRQYGNTMLAHGATIIPLAAGMFISGLLYGDFLIHSQIPNIDTIEQLERSNLTIRSAYLDARVKNEIIHTNVLDTFDMIWSGNTNYAYIIPERWTGLLDSDHLRRNGRPLFHVVKERFGIQAMTVYTTQWPIQNRLNKIIKRLHEHGFRTHFERMSKFLMNERGTAMQSNNLDQDALVAEAGGIQELQIACYIYLVGMACGIVAFIVEYFTKRISP